MREGGIARLVAALLPCVWLAGQPAAAQVTITNSSGLSFGSFSVSSSGSVLVSASGARSSTGGVVLLGSGPAASAAQFSVRETGGNASVYVITLPADNTVTLTNANSQTATLTSFVSNPSGTSAIPAGGTQVLSVGATVVLATGQGNGSYAGSFSVTVNLQ